MPKETLPQKVVERLQEKPRPAILLSQEVFEKDKAEPVSHLGVPERGKGFHPRHEMGIEVRPKAKAGHSETAAGTGVPKDQARATQSGSESRWLQSNLANGLLKKVQFDVVSVRGGA